ncbi:hypothetical protein TraAM80_09334 [Trypanosoma rangeli]|uniref:EF-hand domain-containing protein n=1 Tax=Trypanosoma rangeli TaxID=5698 RepID=A0A3R7MYZ1_TRYRA|nr:uncharacterized protein TraAM80_09334 [Trypanosoma rangeli]RNE97411.1 hypothetical protein TraAM80_09334 [Trypanosoma rangeli]|eukprot:RNE97411.1 hypothetical protein TraAM80_09334 [Trypanosoma rangeli]
MVRTSSQSHPQTTSNSLQEERLNTKDLEKALDTVFSLGKPRSESGSFALFEYIVDAGKTILNPLQSRQDFQNFMQSDFGKRASAQFLSYLDADGDGRVTPRDFQVMYDRDLNNFLRRHQRTLDSALPLIGQCAFGFTVGFVAGRVAHRMYKNKVLILTSSFVLYSGLQFLAQMNFVNQNLLEAAFREKLRQLADTNGDGEINREDLNFLVENRMRYVATKLGPGGIAPGVVGYATLGIGLLRGMRRI